jgi:TolB-like protein/two-component SAPR family response regulator
MLQLKLLGGAMVEDEHGVAIGLSSPRYPLALLALLAAAPTRTLSRGKLVGLLWPEAQEKTARNRLTSCLYHVRRGVGDSAVITLGTDLSYNDEALSCDVRRFEAALQAKEYARAVELYGGPFLDGFWLRDSPEFDQWMDRERDRLRRRYHAALEALACEAWSNGELDTAAAWWRTRALEDPYDSRVAGRLMESLAAIGNRSEAFRVAAEHIRALDEEFGTKPDAELQALIDSLHTPARGAPVRTSVAAGDHPAVAELPVRSIAVLPFQNLSGSEEAEPFTVGIHDDLLTELSRISALTVISRTSVLRYRGSEKTIRQIARELGVGTIVEGGVQSAGGRLRLNVQLIDARTDAHRWVERYDRQLSTGSIFDIQTELAQHIAQSLHAELTPMEKERVGRERTDNLEAYRLYSQGRRTLDQRTAEAMRRSVEYFEQAIALDPGYALAWVGLADALALLQDYRHDSDNDALPRAREAVRRALELDPYLAEAYGSLGAVSGTAGDRAGAEQALRRAVELRPGYAEAHNWLSWHYLVTGRREEALACAIRAVELNPLSQESVSNLSLSWLANGDAHAALREASRVRDMQPDWTSGHFYQALALYHLGRFTEAIAVLEDLTVEWAGSGAELTLALAAAASGDRDHARGLLSRFTANDDHYAAGVVHLALGETKRAFELFEIADCSTYWPQLSLNFFYPDVLAPLRAHPLFSRMRSR